MICRECNTYMRDTYEEIGLGKKVKTGNVYNDMDWEEVPSWYCKKCHLVILDHSGEEEV